MKCKGKTKLNSPEKKTSSKSPSFSGLKALFVLNKYLSFNPHFFGHVGKWLDKKAKVSFKICDIINQKMTIHILPDIS